MTSLCSCRLAILITFALMAVSAWAQSDNDGWTKSTLGESGLSEAKLREMSSAVRSDQFKKIGSIAIARHGKLAFEDYVDGDAATLRDTRSATKSVTDVLIGIALRQGKLSDVHARVLDVLPERARRLQNPDPRKSAITIEDFLTMSSPLECDDWNDASRGNEERMYLVEDWAQFILDLPIRGRMRLGEKPETPEYGRFFSYCTGGAFVLSEVLSRATGTRTDLYAQENLFRPLAITNAEWVYSPLNVPQTGGGLRLSTRSLLKIGQLYLDGGHWHGQQIVAQDWVQNSTRAHARIDDTTEYGYLWWIKSFKNGEENYSAFFMSGNGGNKVVVVPKLDLVAVITSTNFNTRGMHEQSEKIITDYILPAVKN